MNIRAKLKCVSLEPHPTNAKEVASTVRFETSYDGSPDNESWSKYTPNGEMRLYITNPAALEQLIPGKFYYIDIEQVGEVNG